MNEDLNVITLYLRRVPFLRTLPENTLEAIARRMHKVTIPASRPLFRVGDPGDAIYIINSGEIEISTEDGIPIAVMYAGSMLGEVEVLSELPRKVNAYALTDATLWVLNRADLLALAQEHPSLQQAMNQALSRQAGKQVGRPSVEDVRDVTLFQGLDDAQLERIVDLLTTSHHPANTSIYTQGAPAEELYIVAEGEVSVREPANGQILELYRVGEKDVFGVEEVLKQATRQTEAFALTNVRAWVLSATDLNALVEEMPRLALNLARIISDRLIQRQPTVLAAEPQKVAETPAMTVRKTHPPQRHGGLGVWFRHLDYGARVKIIALAVLLVWLIGVAMPTTIHRTMSQNKLYTNVDKDLNATVIGNSPAGVPLASELEASYPTPTATPIPTPTPASTQ